MKKVILFILFPVLLQSQDIPKLQQQLDNENYHKCIKKAKRYAKWHKKNKEVNYYFSVAYFGLINDQKSLYNNKSYLKKSINYLSTFYRHSADRTSKTQQLENALDSTASLLHNNSINEGENYALKRLNKSYKKLSGNNLTAYQQYIKEQEELRDQQNKQNERDQELKMNKEYKEFKDIVMKYAYKYLSPMHIKVLEENYSGPESYGRRNKTTGEITHRIFDEVSDEIVLREIEVVIHETTHMFGGGDERFIVSSTEYIDVQKTEVIRTSLIADDMINRNDAIKDLQLFNIYVNVDQKKYGPNAGRELGSDIGGIYGLMDEYCAYYNGVSASWILYKEFKKKEELSCVSNGIYFPDGRVLRYTIEDSIAERYKDRKEDVGSDALGHMDAFYEFNSFIAAYLIYVQEYHPNIYNNIMNNTEFLRAYAIVTNNFQALAEEIQKEFPENKIKWYHESDNKYSHSVKNVDFNEVMSVYNDYIPFLEELRNIANNQILTKK